MKKQKENSHEGITWSEMGKQNVQDEKVYFGKVVVAIRTSTAKKCTKNAARLVIVVLKS